LTPQDFDELPSLSAHHLDPPEIIGVSCSILSCKHITGGKKTKIKPITHTKKKKKKKIN